MKYIFTTSQSKEVMNNILVVLPVIDKAFADQCLDTILKEKSAAGFGAGDMIIIDNTRHGLPLDIDIEDFQGRYRGINVYRHPDGHNVGVPRAWNVGARMVVASKELEYLVVLSASMRFGPELHTTWLKQMRTFWDANAIECEGHSWHLIAFHRRVFELIGLFDENFYPGYFEAIDFGYRLRMLNMEGGWPRAWVNALSADVGRHTELVLATPLLDYYREKWGGDKEHETFVLPWGDKPLGYFPEVSIPELAKKYNLTNWY